MKREIKFRAIRDDMSNCNWFYGNLIYNKKGEPRIQDPDNSHLFATCLKGTVGQFTGLKDKNGVDIYEGDMYFTYEGVDYDIDIQEYESYIKHTHIVEYKEGVCSVGFQFLRHQAIIEIVGNIHDNPNLLSND